jgi:hypothetical protein
MAERDRACAATARALGEPLAGTAPVATGWLLVEDPGPWGRDGLADGTLPEPARSRLAAALVHQPVRYQAIRPCRDRIGDERRIVLVHAGPDPWARQVTVPGDALGDVLADLDPAVTLHPDPPLVGAPPAEPIVLVCTHGRRDACCAERGRPVAVALNAAHPDLVWETTHTGGHRFAPNVIVLPAGVVYGFLDLPDAVTVVALAREDRIDLDHFRGRSATPRPVQAAEVALRRRLGLDHVGDIADTTMLDRGEDVAVDLVTVEGARWTAVVTAPPVAPRIVSCGGAPEEPEAWEVVSLTPGPA